MRQTQVKAEIKKGPLVSLRVVSKKFVLVYGDDGRTTAKAVDWKGNKVVFENKEYGPGDVFSVDKSTSEELLGVGCVQLASEKPRTYRPPHIDHIIKPSYGVQFASDVVDKIPTRMGAVDRNAEWETEDD